MPAVKTYTRVNFQNYPSTSTPLNATNLNKMDKGIDDLDDEVVTVKNAIENMSFDADSISYDNTSSGLQATDVQDAVDEINDNLSGFKFYPSGTSIVGLISDDSAYTDEDGNYVIWGTATANQLVEDNPNTYKSVPSTEDCRGKEGADSATPFSSSAVEVVEGTSTNLSAITFTVPSGFNPKYVQLTVDGYSVNAPTYEHFSVASNPDIISATEIHRHEVTVTLSGTNSRVATTIYMLEVKPTISSIVLNRTTNASSEWWTKKATFIK